MKVKGFRYRQRGPVTLAGNAIRWSWLAVLGRVRAARFLARFPRILGGRYTACWLSSTRAYPHWMLFERNACFHFGLRWSSAADLSFLKLSEVPEPS